MFSYKCPNCGASAYSAANASMVGACPRCDASLATDQSTVALAAPLAAATR